MDHAVTDEPDLHWNLFQDKLELLEMMLAKHAPGSVGPRMIAEPDPTVCGVLFGDAPALPDLPPAAVGRAAPIRLYVRHRVMRRLLDGGQRMVLTAMEMLGVEKLVLLYDDSDDIAGMTAELARRGLRSGRQVHGGALIGRRTGIAMSYTYSRPAHARPGEV